MMAYDFDSANKVIHLRASGVLIPGDPIKYFEEINKDRSFQGKAEEKIYFTDLEDIRFSYSGIVSIRDAFVKFSHGDKISSGIFIVDSDLSFGMARMVISIFGQVYSSFDIQRID